MTTHLNFPNQLAYGREFLETLLTRHRVDEDEGVAFGDIEPLHGRELMAARRVRDVQGVDVTSASDDLFRRKKKIQVK